MSIPRFDKAQLLVHGETKVDDLRDFIHVVERKGGGQVRAEKLGDGRYRLYVSADHKPRISTLFPRLEKQAARTARVTKQGNASEAIDQILYGANKKSTGNWGSIVHSAHVSQALKSNVQSIDGQKDERVQSAGKFSGHQGEASGGATGSRKVGEFQVKTSVAEASLPRRLKARGLETENFAEVIASNVARAAAGSANEHLFPEVKLVQSNVTHMSGLSSKYLSNGVGDLDRYYADTYAKTHGALPAGRKHVQVDLDPTHTTGNGTLVLKGDAAEDIARNLALSCFVGDHDVNPGNNVVVKDPNTGEIRIGRIDFGHAFNDLIMGMGGKALGGGGVHDSGNNRIRDFFNRESVSHNPLTSDKTTKLWRDYVGVVPSQLLADALRELARSDKYQAGLAESKKGFIELVADLDGQNSPAARKQLAHLEKSLARLSANIGKEVHAKDAGEMVEEVFANLDTFFAEGKKQMEYVAGLCELQFKIDEFIRLERKGGADKSAEDAAHAEAKKLYETLTSKGSKSIMWLKFDAEVKACEGNFDDYLRDRRKLMAHAPTGAAARLPAQEATT